jgi:hypothetical protein
MDPMNFGYDTSAVDAMLHHRYGALPNTAGVDPYLPPPPRTKVPGSSQCPLTHGYGANGTSAILAHRYG